ncbi:MAG: RimK family alpha-L-glutamate ligase [Candidatus Nanohalobium sp.]
MTESIGVIWGDAISKGEKPFSKDYQNRDYQSYSEIAERKGLELFYGHYNWYGDGKLSKAFRWTGTGWELVSDVDLDGAFDKFPFNDETEPVKKALNADLPVVNDFELEKFCKDKLRSAEEFPEMFPDTSSEEFLEDMIEEHGKVVVKPRFGHGGEDVHIIESSEGLELEEDVEYVVQEFVKASEVPLPGVEGEQHDLRIVFVDNEPVYTYVRTPKSEEEVSNVAEDGSITYIDLENVPGEVMSLAREVSERLEGYRPCLFSVDFIISEEDRPYVLELNSKPGMYFSDSEGEEEYERPGVEALIDALTEL